MAGSFDSLSAVELSNGIATALGLQLPGTLVFDYPSVRTMAVHVQGLMAPAGAPVPAHVTAASLIASPSDAHASELLARASQNPQTPPTCNIQLLFVNVADDFCGALLSSDAHD